MGMQIKNLTPREAEVYLFDEIGYWGDTAGDVVDTLRDLDVDHIAVKINSPGGDVFDGIAIMNILKSHPRGSPQSWRAWPHRLRRSLRLVLVMRW